MTNRSRAGWGLPVALVALGAVPLVSGAFRVIEVLGGPHVLPTNQRISDSPAPLVVHVLGAAVYVLLGALQFPARFRRLHRAWHRRTGRLLVVAGLCVALSGLWMTVFYAAAPGGTLLWSVRLVVSTSMALALILGLRAIRRRNLGSHRAWMIRAYALALGAGTQVFTQGFGEAVLGHSDLSIGASVSAGWLLNAIVAEWVIRRPPRRRGRAGHDRASENGISARVVPAG